MKENVLIKCFCGCGQKRWKYDKRGRERRYINTHYLRGFKHTLMSREQMKNTRIKKISEGKIKVWNLGTKGIMKPNKTSFKKGNIPHNRGKPYHRGRDHHMYGKKHKQSSLDKMRKSRIEGLKKGNIKIWNKGKTGLMASWNKGIIGEKSHSWKGGKSFEPYGVKFNNKLKRLIRKRDNQICMVCGIHREKINRALHIHHINYDKTCNLIQNFIALCTSCHIKTNFNRKHWQKFFQDLLSNRYDYNYSEGGEIILNIEK